MNRIKGRIGAVLQKKEATIRDCKMKLAELQSLVSTRSEQLENIRIHAFEEKI